MKKLLFNTIKSCFLLRPFFVRGQSSMPENTQPINWVRSGTDATSYTMGISNQNSHSGSQSVFIKSLQLATSGEYGTLATTVKPGKYRGKKIRYSAWLKTKEVDSACF